MDSSTTTTTKTMKTCPLCGHEVHGRACGGSSFFSDEYEYEIECDCGLLFNYGPCRTPEEAEAGAIEHWNKRAIEPTD